MRSYFGSYCGAINCNTNQKYNREISLYRFPKDAERSKKWLINTRRADLMKKDTQYLYKNIKICALHFEESQFMNVHKKKLVWNAVPTLFDVPNQPPAVSPKHKLSNRCTLPVQKKQKVWCSVDATEEFESKAAVCDRVKVKVEQETEYEEDSREMHRPQEPEYIEVKEEPLEEEEEDTDAGPTQQDSLGF